MGRILCGTKNTTFSFRDGVWLRSRRTPYTFMAKLCLRSFQDRYSGIFPSHYAHLYESKEFEELSCFLMFDSCVMSFHGLRTIGILLDRTNPFGVNRL